MHKGTYLNIMVAKRSLYHSTYLFIYLSVYTTTRFVVEIIHNEFNINSQWLVPLLSASVGQNCAFNRILDALTLSFK